MVFSSNIFLFLFLPAVIACYFLLPANFHRSKNFILLIFSLLFYAWGEIVYLWLLLLSIVGNYLFGIWICAGEIASEKGFLTRLKNSKGFALFLALTFNLSLLLYFKYAHFLADNVDAVFAGFSVKKSLLPHHLPIGISFFTFHAISYLIDIYRQKSKAQRDIFVLSLYISFFPQLVAGPIVRYNFVEKYLKKRRQNFVFFAYGVRRFMIGFAKKVIIANPLGEIADVVFSSQMSEVSSVVAWIGIICYSLQIYFDFSGYSDMAVGLARIFGFKFPENFNFPYISRSIKEFWRRWHMSLSSWFRDYVYIPLGGNRVDLVRQYFNLVLVFFLCGLWHGASWNFVIWGLFHGAFLVVERLRFFQNILMNLPKILQHFYAIFVVMIGWVFFRSADLSSSLGYLNAMFSFSGGFVIAGEVAQLINSHFVWMSLSLALIGFSPAVRNFSLYLMRKNKNFILAFDFVLLLAFVFAVIRLSAATHNPFIYFQF